MIESFPLRIMLGLFAFVNIMALSGAAMIVERHRNSQDKKKELEKASFFYACHLIVALFLIVALATI